MKNKIANKIESEYDAIDENMAEIQRLLSQINSSVELIRYLNYLDNTYISTKIDKSEI